MILLFYSRYRTGLRRILGEVRTVVHMYNVLHGKFPIYCMAFFTPEGRGDPSPGPLEGCTAFFLRARRHQATEGNDREVDTGLLTSGAAYSDN